MLCASKGFGAVVANCHAGAHLSVGIGVKAVGRGGVVGQVHVHLHVEHHLSADGVGSRCGSVMAGLHPDVAGRDTQCVKHVCLCAAWCGHTPCRSFMQLPSAATKDSRDELEHRMPFTKGVALAMLPT